MKKNQTKIFLVLLIAALPLLGFGCKFSQSSEVKELYQPIELSWWGVWEDSADVAAIIEAYETIHPNITITYRKFRFEEYEEELTKAWLEQRGPDIFSIPADAIREYQNLIEPMPTIMKLPYVETTGTIKKEQTIVVKQVAGLTAKKVQELFVDAVAKQAVIDDKVYGLPLSVDTLALYYNRDLLNAAKIPLPATTWAELVEQIPELTTFDNNGNIIQSGIALGTGDNIPRATDILSLLMLQNGTTMIDENGYAIFNQPPEGQKDFLPAKDALEFYTDFANSVKKTYTWSEQMPDALEAFTSGELAYFIGYAYQLPTIKSLAPKLNFNVAPMLQTANEAQEVNFANFWVMATYFGTTEKNIAPAWNFIQYATTSSDLLKEYLTTSQRPTALRSLINDQIQEEGLGIFADQLLSSVNWYRGSDPDATESLMLDLIDQARTGLTADFDISDLLNLTVNRINQTIKKSS